VIRALERAGFVLSRTRGAHRIYRHSETGRRVTVPYHRGRLIPPGTLENILKEAGITVDELEELL
jgi:predicted RNA binding protein YcfA (HicA-like mRNA interferase family)